MRFLLFPVLLLLSYIAGNVYIYWHIRRAMPPLRRRWRVAFALLYWCCVLLTPSFFLIPQDMELPPRLTHVVYNIGNSWLVFTLYMVLALGLTDLLRLCKIRLRHRLLIPLAAVLLLLGYGYYCHRFPVVRQVELDLRTSASGEGRMLKAVCLSDIHLGFSTDRAALSRYVDLISSLHPDVVLIAGDLIDRSVTPLYEERMAEELARLSAPMGIYMVPGNHEYISGIEKSVRFLRSTPIRLLRDSVADLPGGIQIVGRDDRYNRTRLSRDEILAGTDAARPVIILEHQPHDLQALARTHADLQFSGHTHRGQVWPFNLLTDLLFEQSHGLRKWGGTQVYVSSGLSLWGPPFRIGTRAELVLFHIRY